MAEADNVAAYLTMFERTAEREFREKEWWAGILAPFLTGEVLQVYHDLQAGDAEEYQKLKAEILSRVSLTPLGKIL